MTKTEQNNRSTKRSNKEFKSTNDSDVIADISNLPFRPSVGMMILNKHNKIFVGKRIDSRGWQMPQGGINLGETPSSAAIREMEEEIGCGKGKIIAESRRWYSYRLPISLISKLWDGKYCGQKQRWFLIEYYGSDEEIDLMTNSPEFEAWKWASVAELPKIIIPFKKRLYREVLSEFREIIRNRNASIIAKESPDFGTF